MVTKQKKMKEEDIQVVTPFFDDNEESGDQYLSSIGY